MRKRQEGGDSLPVVFIHSSFRTGSTWLWSKFRENSGCYCYYEIFNEILGEINFKNILHSAADWNSHHPRGAPYFSEFSPLLDQTDGIVGFDQEMALSDFFLNSEANGDRVRRTEAYLTSLIKLAQHNSRIPVLSCTRSIGRAKLIRELIGGTHILLRRRLLNQWFSYSNQALNKNPFFFNTVIRTVNARNSDTFIGMLANLLKDNEISQDSFGEDHDTLLIVFLCLHIYLYIKNKSYFDIVIDFNKGSSQSDLGSATRLIADVTQVRVDLSDYSETISAPSKLIRDVDRVFSMVRSLFARPIPGLDDEKLSTLVDDELADFKQGYEQYCRIAGSAHGQLEAYAIERSQLEHAHKAVAEELAVVHQQTDELRTRLEAATGDLATVKEAEVAMQRERALFGEQSAKTAERLHELEAELERTSNARDALNHDVQQATSRETELAVRLEAAMAELEVVTRRFKEAEVAMQQERALFGEQSAKTAERLHELEVDLERTSNVRDALNHDVQQAKSREAELAARLEAAMAELEVVTRRFKEAEVAIHQERAHKELAWEELDFVSTGKAKAQEDLERRWDAMIKRIR